MMVRVEALASSSAGNAYRVTDGATSLLLEAGIPFNELRKALDFRVSELAGCLITHEHGDHSKAVHELIKAGVDVYTSEGTLKALRLSGHRARPIRAKEQFVVGTWTVMPFETQHDAAEALGFLMTNRAGDKMAFITDTYYVRYQFSGLTHLMVECNFSQALLDANIAAGRVPAVMRSRLLRSHFSLEHVKDFLRANDLSSVREIHLLHLSDNNSDAEMFKREIQEIAGCPVYVADRSVV